MIKLATLVTVAVLALAGGLTSSYEWTAPAHFPQPQHDFKAQPLDSARVALGRALFFDASLSRDGTISCASCHSPYNAFAHTDHTLSHGIDDSIGRRNAPALFNLAWQRHFMWDGASHSLAAQALAPLEHVGEMDSDLPTVLASLRENPSYVAAFATAFEDRAITGERVLNSLAEFQLTLVSANAKYDRVQAGLDSFSRQELAGQELFLTHCNSCHTAPLFTNGDFAKNGLTPDVLLADVGRAVVSQVATDSFAFKVPSLRNLRFSYPYMHDGRFRSLGQVLRHYGSGLDTAQHVDASLRTLQLDGVQRTDLLAFLRTLDDEDFVFAGQHQFPRAFFFPSEG